MAAEPTSLGAFSVSLAVADIAASRAFYEAMGFSVSGGDVTRGWLILRNGAATIGLFQGMFERNLLTFNPGWDAQAQAADGYTDVREHQQRLKAAGLTVVAEVQTPGPGPGSFMLVDPDGNPVLIDQHL